MGTTPDKVKYLADSIEDIRLAICEKDVDVAEDIPLRKYGDKIREIKGGADHIEDYKVRTFRCGEKIKKHDKVTMFPGTECGIIDFFPYGTQTEWALSANGKTLVCLVSDVYPFVYVYERDEITGDYKLAKSDFRIRTNCNNSRISPDGNTVFLQRTGAGQRFEILYNDNGVWRLSAESERVYNHVWINDANNPTPDYTAVGGDWSNDSSCFCCVSNQSSYRAVHVFKRKFDSYDLEWDNSLWGGSSVFVKGTPVDCNFNKEMNKIFVWCTTAATPLEVVNFSEETSELSIDMDFSPMASGLSLELDIAPLNFDIAPLGLDLEFDPDVTQPDLGGSALAGTNYFTMNEDRDIIAIGINSAPFNAFFKVVGTTFTRISIPPEWTVSGTRYRQGWGRGKDKNLFVRISSTSPYNHLLDFTDTDNVVVTEHIAPSSQTAYLSMGTINPPLYDRNREIFINFQYTPLGRTWEYDAQNKKLYHSQRNENYNHEGHRRGTLAAFTSDRMYIVQAFVGSDYPRYGYVLLKFNTQKARYDEVFFFETGTDTFTSRRIEIRDDFVYCSGATSKDARVLKINRGSDTLINCIPDVALPNYNGMFMVVFGYDNEYVALAFSRYQPASGHYWYKLDKEAFTLTRMPVPNIILPRTPDTHSPFGQDSANQDENGDWFYTRTVTAAKTGWSGNFNAQRFYLFKLDKQTDTLINISVSIPEDIRDSTALYGSLLYGTGKLKCMLFTATYPFVYTGLWNGHDFEWSPYNDLYSAVNARLDWKDDKIYAPAFEWIFDNDTGEITYWKKGTSSNSPVCHSHNDFITRQGTTTIIMSQHDMVFNYLDAPNNINPSYQMFGQALQDGQTGDFIKVKCLY